MLKIDKPVKGNAGQVNFQITMDCFPRKIKLIFTYTRGYYFHMVKFTLSDLVNTHCVSWKPLLAVYLEVKFSKWF